MSDTKEAPQKILYIVPNTTDRLQYSKTDADALFYNNNNLDTITQLPNNTVNSIHIETHQTYSPALLKTLLEKLIDNGELHATNVPTDVKLDSALTYAGFINIKTTTNNDNTVDITAYKPTWNSNSSAKFTLKKKSNNAVKLDSNTINAWNTAVNTHSDIIDDSKLLDEETDIPVITNTTGISIKECGPNSEKKQACKNCSCGYAEQLQSVKITDLKDGDAVPVKSQCGSCGLGDAFRCATCPYAGQPAFKVKDGAVKLQL